MFNNKVSIWRRSSGTSSISLSQIGIIDEFDYCLLSSKISLAIEGDFRDQDSGGQLSFIGDYGECISTIGTYFDVPLEVSEVG